MKFFLYENLDSDIVTRHILIETINFSSSVISKLIDNLTSDYKEEILHNLNSINNQGIINIDFDSYKYQIDDTILKFDKLCTAERIFLLATAAKILEIEIYLYNDITQLSKTTLKTFFKLFYNSQYVNIVYNHKSEQYYLREVLQEAGYDYAINR